MEEYKINHWACLTAIVIILAFLYTWYNFIFYDTWLKANDMIASEFEVKRGFFPYFVSLATTVIIVYLLAWLFAQIKITGFESGLVVALGLGFGFTFLNVLGQDLYLFRPLKISLIDGGANLIACMIAGGILGGWRKVGPVSTEV